MSTKKIREHCQNVMKKITLDRENPRSFLEFFMATRYVMEDKVVVKSLAPRASDLKFNS